MLKNFKKKQSADAQTATIVETAPNNPTRSRPLIEFSRLEKVRRQARRTRDGPSRVPLQLITHFIKKCIKRYSLIKHAESDPGKRSSQEKAVFLRDRSEILGLPGLFDKGLLAEFLGPMKRAIMDNDGQSFLPLNCAVLVAVI